MVECTKNDWKLFKNKIQEWQERYIEKLNNEYIEILNGKESAADKFWKIEERIRKDKKHPGVIVEMNKQDVIFNIFRLLDAEVIEQGDLEDFSEELKGAVNFLMSRR